ncbi:3-deoxy-D-manno-octulosonic-acid transferase [Salinimicrobium sediminis]|uniref:3-deoxy-D-manno-octulosonic acid transferase n=1 Tax=Salinimicrobium sediminis TaxID=1343891 RepID=A0A285X0E0_9FLAO|nr:glycosyltransferase N-terminal domain-containing protein [Salinimicrobium sediminis]SOC78841.1 3-deoxy-D-manno-octulosonic-acid transferase [Salinimicrobium sediminis]
MHFLYNFLVNTTEKLLPLSGRFNEKLKLFTEGRRGLFEKLASEISPQDKTILIHAASLGEYEQAVPVILKLKEIFPKHKIVLSFFSPSGYEVKKDRSLADVVTYLPLDTQKNAEGFLDLVHPDWVLFVKYEFWPNLLRTLQKRNIRSLLISGAFREDQLFFKPYGRWMQKYLEALEFFFLQNKSSLELLQGIGFENARVSGDTRYDRVSAQLEQDNRLIFIEEFLQDKLCLVAGSTWPEDEELLVDYLNAAGDEVKFIIAPHTLKKEKIRDLQEKVKVPTVLYSDKADKKLEDYKVFVIDTIGLLTRIYSYADIAYVGGAAGDTGLHNVLEPAAFGIPVIIGKNYSKFPEASALKEAGALFSVKSKEEAAEVLNRLLQNEDFRRRKGKAAADLIEEQRGATLMISDYLLKNK